MVDCVILVRHPKINTVGRVPFVDDVAAALNDVYWHEHLRNEIRGRGLSLVEQERFRWSTIAAQFDRVLKGAVERAQRMADALPTRALTFTTRPGTTDAAIVHSVYTKNEYGLPPRLGKGDLIVDIGAHIGAFAAACLDRGAGLVLAYEADIDNVARCERHLSPYGDRARVVHAAVWRSDVINPDFLYHTGYSEMGELLNTGGGGVFFGEPSEDGQAVETISLDAILAGLEGRRVAILKLDCETSEFPILLTSARLDQVDTIVGEYHEAGGEFDTHTIPPHAAVEGVERFTIAVLASHLEQQGFIVTHARARLPTGGWSNIGSFRAERP
jgi:FkbM family methyltransferase